MVGRVTSVAYTCSVTVARHSAKNQSLWYECCLRVCALVSAEDTSRPLKPKLYRGIHNPSPGTLDFEAWRDWQPFLDMAKAVGLWVVFRPGIAFYFTTLLALITL
jgi:Glycosyl hydrolases family 35